MVEQIGNFKYLLSAFSDHRKNSKLKWIQGTGMDQAGPFLQLAFYLAILVVLQVLKEQLHRRKSVQLK